MRATMLLLLVLALATIGVSSTASAITVGPVGVGPVGASCGGAGAAVALGVPPTVTVSPPSCTVTVLGTSVTLPP